jgi:hypothetical protein
LPDQSAARSPCVAADSNDGENIAMGVLWFTIRCTSPRAWTAALVLSLGASVAAASADGLDVRLTDALRKAGSNRSEIERFLDRYAQSADREKRDASRWLVANMEGHGFASIELVDAEGAALGFDALAYTDLSAAKAAFDALQRAHPGTAFKRVRFASDLEHASADFLSTNLEDAFTAWRMHPWAKSVRFEVFRDFILPYRGSNEPLGLWREPARARLAAVVEAHGSEHDVRAVGESVRRAVHQWVGFSNLFYLHPTDQSYDEMCARRLGRCEDITNMIAFGMRSVAALCASDYTPWWADRDNNHAWEVVLDSEGRGRAGLSHRCAKVYRKTFAMQRCSLAKQRREDEVVPRWLSSPHFVDVTDQYQPVTDVVVELPSPPAGARFAYLAVFNGGAWRPIQWGKIDEGRARFTKMGRDICYLPMYHRDGHDVPAGVPFILTRDGCMRPLRGSSTHLETLYAVSTRPAMIDADTRAMLPNERIDASSGYELFRWSDNGWMSVRRHEPGALECVFEGLPSDALYWLVEDGSTRLERIFTIEDGRQVFW